VREKKTNCMSVPKTKRYWYAELRGAQTRATFENTTKRKQLKTMKTNSKHKGTHMPHKTKKRKFEHVFFSTLK
jgi:hypothetical protein